MVGFGRSGSFSSSWLSSFLAFRRRRRGVGDPPPEALGILSFEAARVMSRLCALHNALSDPVFFRRLRFRSIAVCFLVSQDQVRLLRLAAAEMLLDLNAAAEFVSRLALRCPHRQSPWPRAFPQVYDGVKTSFDSRFAFPAKEAGRRFQKMDRYAAEVDTLYDEMEALAEMEDSQLKLRRWGTHSGPLSAPLLTPQRGNDVDPFHKQLAAKRSLVQRLRNQSLWSVEVDKVTDLMGRAIVTIHARLCSAFAAVVPELPVFDADARGRTRLHPRVHPNFLSGPLERKTDSAMDDMGVSGPMGMTGAKVLDGGWAAKVMEPGEKTVGAAGLALRYANIVVVAERMLSTPEVVVDEAKEELYAMLPFSLRDAVAERKGEVDGSEVAATRGGDTARSVLSWLGPMAADTLRWHAEKSCERRSGVSAAAAEENSTASTRVFALQTLRYADRRKTEGAIADVLVGLSCVIRHLQIKEEEELAMLWDDSRRN